MKKTTFISTCLLLIIINCQAQRRTLTAEDYMNKSHKRMTGAWIFLGAGTAMTTGGIILLANGIHEDRYGDDYYSGDNAGLKIVGGAVMMVGGIALMGTSIPFFIMGHKYRKKAMNLSYKTEKIQLPKMGGRLGNEYYPALSLRFNLTK